jgi:hypothetical protein
LVVSLLIFFLGSSVQIHSAPQEGGPGIKQKISKTGKAAAAQAKVRYQGEPQFALIDGTSITYTANATQAVLNTGDAFYVLFPYYNPLVLSMQNVWLISSSPQGPWVPAPFVPQKVATVV